MLYAVIADIHGNYPALQAVLEDAQKAGAEQYFFWVIISRIFPSPAKFGNTDRPETRDFCIRKPRVVYGGTKSKAAPFGAIRSVIFDPGSSG